ncbi:hypothetical protein ABEJ45_05515, partial [Geobacillus thermoleovorans]
VGVVHTATLMIVSHLVLKVRPRCNIFLRYTFPLFCRCRISPITNRMVFVEGHAAVPEKAEEIKANAIARAKDLAHTF